MFKYWGVVVLVAACGTLIRPPDPDRRLGVHTEGTTFDSDRGYQFVVLPEPHANVVRLDVRYPVGSIDDPVGKEGLAHLVEHLLTEVEVNRDGTATSIDGELARVALSFNAHTTAEATTYEALALPAALDDLIRIEAERITTGCAAIPRELFDREREVVRNELRERTTLANAVAQLTLPELHAFLVRELAVDHQVVGAFGNAAPAAAAIAAARAVKAEPRPTLVDPFQ
jgi:zinc protease